MRFQHGSLNPNFFMYPTLYYYLTYLFLAVVQATSLLFWGRILNLAFVGFTAWLAYTVGRVHLFSRIAGIFAALFIVSNPTIVQSGSYLCTDALLAASVMGTIFLVARYFADRSRASWLAAMVVLGLAVGCKYTAFLLFFAYAITEMCDTALLRDTRDAELRFPRRAFAVILAGCALLLLACASLFPTSALLGFVAAHRQNADLRSTAEYRDFLHHLGVLLVCGSAGAAAAAFAAHRSVFCYRVTALRRLYTGFCMVALVVLVVTPFSVIVPAKFVYDLGALARSNVIVQSTHAEWGNYGRWLMKGESMALVFLGLCGLALIAWRADRRFRFMFVFTAIYLMTIGSSHLGFPRYLTPVLQVAYLGAGYAVASVLAIGRPRWFWCGSLAVAAILCVACFQLRARWGSPGLAEERPDEFAASYRLAMARHPNRVFYAGYAPSVELESSGIAATQVSWASLQGAHLGDTLGCDQLLFFDDKGATAHALSAIRDASVVVLLDDTRGYGRPSWPRQGVAEARLASSNPGQA